MDPYQDGMVTVRRLLAGFRASVDRFDSAAGEQSLEGTFLAIFEALNWATSLDERIGKHWAPDGTCLGFAWRDRVRGAEVLGGVRYARNSMQHDWADAIWFQESGFGIPMPFPIEFGSWLWRSPSDLPEKGKPDPKGHAVYEAELSGNPVRGTLRALDSAFARIGELLEPWQPEREV